VACGGGKGVPPKKVITPEMVVAIIAPMLWKNADMNEAA
jgi:hypothetical protein